MPFISGKKIIKNAHENRYAIGAFTAHNAETIRAVLSAAEEEQSPIMIQIGQKAIQTLGLHQLKDIVNTFMRDITVPVCVHLDHSRSFEQTMEAARAGFNSLMFDGSHLPFEENVRITKTVADVAHALGLGMEGEIGKIGGTEDNITVDEKDAMLTTPEEALAFAIRTTVDYLAVSIGTAHGVYKSEPQLAFERLRDIRDNVGLPLVLHGGSGVPDHQLREAISLGVCKVNVDTELRQAFTRGVQEVFAENPNEFTLAVSLGRGEQVMKQTVIDKIRVFGSQGKATLF